ncbi:MAG: hypothetical protein R2912_06775 [Eubacteriales bacterium]
MTAKSIIPPLGQGNHALRALIIVLLSSPPCPALDKSWFQRNTEASIRQVDSLIAGYGITEFGKICLNHEYLLRYMVEIACVFAMLSV